MNVYEKNGVWFTSTSIISIIEYALANKLIQFCIQEVAALGTGRSCKHSDDNASLASDYMAISEKTGLRYTLSSSAFKALHL